MGKRPLQLDGYIRVSRVGGREGESFISPDVQRHAIERWAEAHDTKIVAWHTDLDQSGSKRSRPGLDAAMQRIRTGQTDGIVVAKLDRFFRSLAGALDALREIEESKAAFISVADNIDLSTPTGRAFLRILLVFAELEWDRVRDNWAVAQREAVKRGIHIASKTPTGYLRAEDGRLVPHPEHAPAIREAFQMRAGGDSWRTICKRLDERGVEGPYGQSNWRTRAVQHIIGNRVYLGEARSGDNVNRTAHEPIVDHPTWEAAQASRGVPTVRSEDPGLLVGLLRCAGCRYLLKPDRMTIHDGTRVRTYRCRGEHASGTCTDRAAVLGRVIEPYVEAELFKIADALDIEGEAANVELAPLETEADQADAELAAYRDDTRILDALGNDRYLDGLRTRAERADEAHRRLAAARVRLVPSGTPLAANLRDVYGDLTQEEKQKLLAGAFDTIFLRSGRKLPIEDRTVFFRRGEGPDDLPRRGHRVPLRPLDAPGDSGVAGSHDL